MTIFTAEQIRAWDAYTIQQEPIASIDLMERAAQKCVDWILAHHTLTNQHFKIFCGKGNNGGDGLAIARLLFLKGAAVDVFILEFGKIGSADFQSNLQRLHQLPVAIHFIQTPALFPKLEKKDILIDALFGSGLNKPLEGLSASLVDHLNQAGCEIISIDLPSGLFVDKSSKGQKLIKATHTLSFQTYKTAFLFAENAPFVGELHILNIGLHPNFEEITETDKNLVDALIIRKIFRPRQRFAHKGNFGHALMIGGSYGKMGAVLLSSNACLRSGAGLVTAYIPRCGYEILQTALPEAMTMTDEEQNWLQTLPGDLDKFSVIGIGPGMDTKGPTQRMMLQLLSSYKKPLVIDADGLNCLAKDPESLKGLPAYSILTPHPKEFERLFGESNNDFERMEKAVQKAQELNIVIVLKGHHTIIALPSGKIYFNATGTSGMAKGGSGDVLTGIITAFCAQGYTSAEAAIMGVYVHGLAADFAAKTLSKEAMMASDIITFLSQAFQQLNSWRE